MATLNGTDANSTFKQLLQIGSAGSGLSGSLQTVQDGTGAASTLQLSTAAIGLTGAVVNGVTITASAGSTIAITAGKTLTFADTVNLASTFTTAGAFTQAGAFATTLTTTATTNSTLPSGTHTLVGQDTSDTLTNKTLTTPIIGSILDSNSNTILTLTPTASAVNSIKITNTATGNYPIISSAGETFRGIAFKDVGGNYLFNLTSVSSPVDYVQITNGTNNGAAIQLISTQTNASLTINAKGSGGVVIGSAGATTTPVALTNGTYNVNFSTPTLTATRTVTFPDSAVKLASQVASICSLSALGTFAAGSTNYVGASSYASTGIASMYIPFACTLSNMYAITATAPGGADTHTYVLYKNGSTTAITSTTAGAATTSHDTSHTVTCAAGDYISMQIVLSGGATTTTYVSFALQCTAI